MRKIVKKLVPETIISSVRSAFSQLDYKVVKTASKTKISANIYYLFNKNFTAEHQAVLKGKIAYYDSLLEVNTSCALLRRNIHRLEKGLIMKPRRNVFAERFIQETVDCYVQSMRSTHLAIPERKWATDALDEYFKVVDTTPIINSAKKTYHSARNEMPKTLDLALEFPCENGTFKPYPYRNLPSTSINFDELKNLFVRRRSVRWYIDKAVPLDLIQRAANIASFAPSACNRQPYRFLFCNEKEKVISIADCAMGTVGFAENLPAIIAIVGDLSAYPAERDRHLIYIDGSLASMQLMLALETLGLSTCSINWPDIDAREQRIREIIDLKDYERVVMLLAVGYADATGGIAYSQKKENNLILEDISR